MTVQVKICGITRPEDARAAADAGADLVGLNFWAGSRRHLDVETAVLIAAALPPGVRKVGVFVNAAAEDVEAIAARVGLDLVQFHGDEDLGYCERFAGRYIRAVRVGSEADLEILPRYSTDTVLLDTPSEGYGGSGRTFSWALARAAHVHGKRIILAGGLTPENVAQAVAAAAPWAVDVAGGVESAPGLKDHDKLRRFVEAAKGP
jgi:phosphoribosylanthranilate isomerase